MRIYSFVYKLLCFAISFFSIITVVYSQTLEDAFIEAGANKHSLVEVLDHYKASGENQKYEAAVFLIKNMPIHSSWNYKFQDVNSNTIPFSEFDYTDFSSASEVIVKLKDSLQAQTTLYTEKDINKMSSKLLIENIDLAFVEWKNNPWSKAYSFKTFCEYILPYRSLIEPLENWRADYQFLVKEAKYNLEDHLNPVETCIQIIHELESFNFNSKRIDPIPLLSPQQMLFRREGACPDLANLALFASRAIGVAVTFDFTPHHGASSNRHFWNTVIDADGNHIPFNGSYIDNGNGLPYNYTIKSKRLGKAFRYTYSIQEQALATKLKSKAIPEGFLRKKNIIDVTNEYVSVSKIHYKPRLTNTDSIFIAYLNVFNTRKWRVTDWAEKTKDYFQFTNLGKDIVYLPSFYVDEKMIYAKYPILLDEKGNSHTLKPDLTNTFEATLSRKDEYKNNYTDNNPFHIELGEKYMLLYWDKKWIKSGVSIATTAGVNFKTIPSNALYLLLPKKPNGFERIFTLDNQTKKIIWY